MRQVDNMDVDELERTVFQGMDPRAPMLAYEAVARLAERARHAERKWHNWHKSSGTYGITCPACKVGQPAEEQEAEG